MTAKRSIGQRIVGLPGAVWRRLRHQWVLFRARRLSLDRIAARRPRRLLVLCYGNIYRSPFVATWLGTRLDGQPGFKIRSAGFHRVTARPSPPDYVRLTSGYRVDLESHRSRLVTPADLEWAEAIVIMDRHNWERLRPYGADIQGKIIWLGAFAESGPLEIEDPYAKPPPRVQAIVDEMRGASDGLARWLLGSGARN